MVANKVFTYEDHNAGKFQDHHRRLSSQTYSRLVLNQHLPTLNTTTSIAITTASNLTTLVSSNQKKQSNTTINKFLDIIPFIYFHWILVLIAIILTISLLTFFIWYCRKFYTNYRTRKKSPSNFTQYRTKRRRIRPQIINQPTTIKYGTYTTPPCPSKSLECLNYQLHRQDLNITNSPKFARLNTHSRQSLSTFTNSTSYLPSASSSRLSTRSFDHPLKLAQLYESQRVSIEVDDELNENYSTTEIN